RARQGRARSLSRVQRLQERLPRLGRYGDLQGRVPVALLQGTDPSGVRVRDGPDPPVGADGRENAAAGESRHATAGRVDVIKEDGRDRACTRDTEIRNADVRELVPIPQ